MEQSILVFGASSVFGKMDPHGGFINRLKMRVEQEHNKDCVYNLGIPGDTSTGICARLVNEAKCRRPTMILFSLGSNDIARSDSPSGTITTPLKDYQQNIQTMIKLAKNMTTKVLVMSAYPIDDTKTQPFHGSISTKFYSLTDLDVYVEAVKEQCNALSVPYLDVYSKLRTTSYQKYVYDDGLHFNEAGHQYLFEALYPFYQNHKAI